MADIPQLDPAEINLLAFLVRSLEAEQGFVTDEEWLDEVRRQGAWERRFAIARLFDELDVMRRFVSPPCPPAPPVLYADIPDTQRYVNWHLADFNGKITKGFEVTGKAVVVHRLAVQERSKEQSGSPKNKSPKRRGPATKFDPNNDEALWEEWQRAKEARTEKKDFAKDKGMTLKNLNRAFGRHRKARARRAH